MIHSRVRLLKPTKHGNYTNMFAVSETLFVVAAISPTITGLLRQLDVRFYNQQSLDVIKHDVIDLPRSISAFSYMYASNLNYKWKGMAFDESRQRLYVFDYQFRNLCCIRDCLTRPNIDYTVRLREPVDYFMNAVEVISTANLIVVLWRSRMGNNYELSMYSTENGVSLQRISLDSYFLEMVQQSENHDAFNCPQMMLSVDFRSRKPDIVIVSGPSFHYLRRVEIPLMHDGAGVDVDQLSIAVNSAVPIVFPACFANSYDEDLPMEVTLLPSDEYLLEFANLSLDTEYRMDFCYLSRSRHAYLTTVELENDAVLRDENHRITYLLPESKRVLIMTTTGGARTVSLRALSTKTWLPQDHHRFNVRTRRAVETMMAVRTFGPEEYWLPNELMFEIFGHL